jgi:hypothetical protein
MLAHFVKLFGSGTVHWLYGVRYNEVRATNWYYIIKYRKFNLEAPLSPLLDCNTALSSVWKSKIFGVYGLTRQQQY